MVCWPIGISHGSNSWPMGISHGSSLVNRYLTWFKQLTYRNFTWLKQLTVLAIRKRNNPRCVGKYPLPHIQISRVCRIVTIVSFDASHFALRKCPWLQECPTLLQWCCGRIIELCKSAVMFIVHNSLRFKMPVCNNIATRHECNIYPFGIKMSSTLISLQQFVRSWEQSLLFRSNIQLCKYLIWAQHD